MFPQWPSTFTISSCNIYCKYEFYCEIFEAQYIFLSLWLSIHVYHIEYWNNDTNLVVTTGNIMSIILFKVEE